MDCGYRSAILCPDLKNLGNPKSVCRAPFTSITHMEMLHGAYRTDNPNAVMLIRDPAFKEGLFGNVNIILDHRTGFVLSRGLLSSIPHALSNRLYEPPCLSGAYRVLIRADWC